MKPKIALISVESKKTVSAFGANLNVINMLERLSSEITWVATNCVGDETRLPKKVNWIKLDLGHQDEEPLFGKIFYHFLHQIRIILELRKLREVDVFIFWGAVLPFPLLFTTLFLRGKTILRIDGRLSVLWRRKPAKEKHKVVRIILHSLVERLVYSLAHKIIVEYESMIERHNLQKWQHKISSGEQYVNTALFRKSNKLVERSYQVGYLGRLSKGKGCLEFAQALPLILKDKGGKAIIVGDGELRENIKRILTTNDIGGKVELTGWIENEKMPEYLNNIKLVVIPSSSEGLPKIVLEAMACGVVVLATPVGGLPDVIKEGKTGFIMEDNSPECIAKNAISVLNHLNLEETSNNACSLIGRKYTYEAAVERYRNILNSLSWG